MFVSIVIPVLNGAEALPQLLASLRQSPYSISIQRRFADDFRTSSLVLSLEGEWLAGSGT
jgi:glycosyltransferase involved in cell wall biosynthesis